ncbi:hypothetical protein [Salinactinospora qingdaonensis]|uniref:hypothetical protein n=1 Tax=Salinactinospora qingdaonensis TaxID=702744 RepID=UPI0031EC2CE6
MSTANTESNHYITQYIERGESPAPEPRERCSATDAAQNAELARLIRKLGTVRPDILSGHGMPRPAAATVTAPHAAEPATTQPVDETAEPAADTAPEPARAHDSAPLPAGVPSSSEQPVACPAPAPAPGDTAGHARQPTRLPFPRPRRPLEPESVTGRRPTREDFPVDRDALNRIAWLRANAAGNVRPGDYWPAHANAAFRARMARPSLRTRTKRAVKKGMKDLCTIVGACTLVAALASAAILPFVPAV